MTEQPSGGPEPATPAEPAADEDVVRFYGPRFQQDPVGTYREIRRRHGSVVPIVTADGLPMWLVLGYREIQYVLSNPQLFSRDTRRWHLWENAPAGMAERPYVGIEPCSMITEGEEHRRRGGAIGDALAGVDQFELRHQIERIADGLVDAFAERGQAELMAEYVMPLPLLGFTWLFGLPESDIPTFAMDIAETGHPDQEVTIAAYKRVMARMRQLVRDKQENPGPDYPSRLLAHPACLPVEEIPGDLFHTLAAGQLSTANWIGNALRLMFVDERFSLNLSGGRRSVGQALTEVLWDEAPIQNHLARWAVQDLQLGGRSIRKGDPIVLSIAAANMDPLVRPDMTADPSGNHSYLSFSHGEHGCPQPARELAEIIAATAIEVILDRLPDVHLSVPADRLEWRPPGEWMRGMLALPVAFTPV